MVDVAGLLPFSLSIGGIVGLLVNVIIIFIVIVIADKVIAHEIEPKKSFIMALIAYLVVPLIFGVVISTGISIPYLIYILPLIAWIILSEVMLKSEMKKKLIVAIVAFIIYTALNLVGVPMMISGLVPI